MPNFNLSQQPQYPIVTKDTDIALTNDQIQSLFCNEDSITLCVRSSSGHPNRGGYYFCIHKNNDNSFQLETIEASMSMTLILTPLLISSTMLQAENLILSSSIIVKTVLIFGLIDNIHNIFRLFIFRQFIDAISLHFINCASILLSHRY